MIYYIVSIVWIGMFLAFDDKMYLVLAGLMSIAGEVNSLKYKGKINDS